MAFDPKELKKLAAACRAAGIKSYKADGIEFVLNDEAPVSPYKKRKAKVQPADHSIDATPVESDGWDTLSEEQKLYYSVQDPLFEGVSDEGQGN